MNNKNITCHTNATTLFAKAVYQPKTLSSVARYAQCVAKLMDGDLALSDVRVSIQFK